MLIEIIKQLRALYKEKKEEEMYRAQLMKMPLNFEALEHLVSKYSNKKITVNIEGGNSIVIEPKDNETSYKSFRDKFEEAHR